MLDGSALRFGVLLGSEELSAGASSSGYSGSDVLVNLLRRSSLLQSDLSEAHRQHESLSYSKRQAGRTLYMVGILRFLVVAVAQNALVMFGMTGMMVVFL